MKRQRNIYTKPATAAFGRIEMSKAICTISSGDPSDWQGGGGDPGGEPGGGGFGAKPFDNSSPDITDNEQNTEE